MSILIKGAGGSGETAPKVCFPYATNDISLELDAGSTGTNYTLTVTIKNFPSNRKLVGLYIPACLTKSMDTFTIAYSLIYSPDANNEYQGCWAGTVVYFLFENEDGNHVTCKQTDDTLVITATLALSGTVLAGLNVGGFYAAAHYIYTE